MKRIKAVRWWLYDLRDLGPDRLRGALLCKPLGHRYTLQKMHAILCDRCRSCIPHPGPLRYTAPDGKICCVECNIHLSSERHHARGCKLRHLL